MRACAARPCRAWQTDPVNATLTVLERAERDYLVVLAAGRGEVVNAPPFESVELVVDEIFEAAVGGETPGEASAP